MIHITSVDSDSLNQLAFLLEVLSGKPTNPATIQTGFQWMEQNEDYLVLGAYDDHRLIGSLMGIVCHDLVGDGRPFMVIENVIVDPVYRGRGIGRKLIGAVETIGRERSCRYTMFVSGAQRQEAHRFYESLGYRLDAVQGFKKYLTNE